LSLPKMKQNSVAIQWPLHTREYVPIGSDLSAD
jgi:hypothetical protein